MLLLVWPYAAILQGARAAFFLCVDKCNLRISLYGGLQDNNAQYCAMFITDAYLTPLLFIACVPLSYFRTDHCMAKAAVL